MFLPESGSCHPDTICFMGTLALTLIVSIVGLLTYALSSNAKLAEVGRLSYFAGLLALLLAVGQKSIHLF